MRCRNRGKVITIWVDEETVRRLDKVAKKIGISRSKLMENLTLIGLEEAETMGKIGVLQLAVILAEIKEKIGKRLDRLETMAGEMA